ncbi:hypothetical protein SAMN02745244_01691 [Tessaracoccus bendigoensis DSM 12906]|uniref:Uncharacterized protein n=1 Tax=Tessaracoccus bendigoensis DSM 12906 TaxID=1123357 RepID=A0A1M6GF22_9ACTN|nr:hypothetical protein SAMN02745244_01691 [Tessaracoccus bendigoensis DSM 12906]
MFAALLLVGCVGRPDPEPAVLRSTPPPWDAPRDAISYIQAAGLPELSLGADEDPWILEISVQYRGEDIEIPAYIGIDRLRAVQAPVHTHEPGGEVWLEGEEDRASTLGDFFNLWGVRFGDGCLGDVCGDLTVTADGQPVDAPTELTLRGLDQVAVSVS